MSNLISSDKIWVDETIRQTSVNVAAWQEANSPLVKRLGATLRGGKSFSEKLWSIIHPESISGLGSAPGGVNDSKYRTQVLGYCGWLVENAEVHLAPAAEAHFSEPASATSKNSESATKLDKFKLTKRLEEANLIYDYLAARTLLCFITSEQILELGAMLGTLGALKPPVDVHNALPSIFLGRIKGNHELGKADSEVMGALLARVYELVSELTSEQSQQFFRISRLICLLTITMLKELDTSSTEA